MNGLKRKQKYPASVRELSLKLNYASPRAHEILRETFNNNLPSKCVLRKWYAQSNFSHPPGVNYKLMKLLERKVAELRAKNTEFICSISMDEMHIRQNLQWCNSTKTLLGYPTYPQDGSNNNSLANQAIVFLLCGVNEQFKVPIAYHFIASLDGKKRSKLLNEVTDALIERGVIIMNITFDGYPGNQTMCTALGANFKFDSDEFKPYFSKSNGHRIYIIKDPPHMLKLVRNSIGNNKNFNG